MNLKSLKKYKVPISILAIVLLSLILIVTLVTLVKPKNKESFFKELVVVSDGDKERFFKEQVACKLSYDATDYTVVTGVENMANCTSVTIPAFVTSIGEGAFSKIAITSIVFADNSQLTSIGKGAFYKIAITSIVIPAGVTSIGDYAFYKTP